ncbi:MAG TPA: hypothetical protein VM935_18610 [Chitinophagaceae bacterium]|nr:hypothetical protein [Chitinophagaceae bacterium]
MASYKVRRKVASEQAALSHLFLFILIITIWFSFLFCLPKKETKKGPGNNNSLFPVGIPIKRLYYCGEEQQGPDVVPLLLFLLIARLKD